ncbi:Hypothetical predicted protein [Lecanosticta acicola]|uniref:Btz domain-containing protein n=1 Tax=Lecanosticta acicola TaxID=111012 RepID=A0AAI8YWF4_9PEZI|nr:Hypothetical predicted protein [Lecanosticta acicola]
MAAGRSLKSLVGRRRRADEEGEDEEGPVMVEDSQSEASAFTDMGDDEADASSLGAPSAADAGADGGQQKSEAASNGTKSASKRARKGKKSAKKAGKEPTLETSRQPQVSNFKAVADTEAMINGLQIGEQTSEEVADFDSLDRHVSSLTGAGDASQPVMSSTLIHGYAQSGAERQSREHEDYKRRRDADPAFIPNRGNFFMHDTRSHAAHSNAPVRGAWNTRGRGRGGPNVGGPFSPANQMAQAERAAEQPWKHDLHDTINEEPSASVPTKADSPQDHDESARLFPKAMGVNQGHIQSTQQPRVVSFSSTTLVGKVQIRVQLLRMKEPIIFSEVPWKQYTRLPDHRPPLRRDKPVRVSLPGLTQRYIFPSSDRSFIFIPRQMRPNQQGFGRYQRSIGGYGYSSRRTSMYGGSMYAASVAASRRSSFASVARESAFSPVGSFAGAMPPTRPVVRLPHGSQSHFSAANTPMGPLSGHQTPTGFQVHTFPLPQQPTFQGTPTTTVHQPRPQKAISVTGIESPAVLQHAPAPPESQPFQNQLPPHMHEQPAFAQAPQAYFSPRQQYSYPQAQNGTPLSNIPEQAINAPSFQPPMMQYAQPYYGYPPQQGFYYPPGPSGYQPMPMYVPPHQGYPMMSPPAPTMSQPPQAAAQQPPSQPVEAEQEQQSQSQSQSGMVAHESNGMVYYMSASEAQQQPQGESYQPAESFVPSYAMPGMPPPTPAPESAYYYPMPMPAAYYPAQGQ